MGKKITLMGDITMEFYKCNRCGNIIAYAKKSGVAVVCCGEPMQQISENTVEASHEKHIPVVARDGMKITVNVGSVAHPMEAAHYIEWIAIETDNGNQRKVLNPGDSPEAVFYVAEDTKLIKACAYCNLHGLWSVSF